MWCYNRVQWRRDWRFDRNKHKSEQQGGDQHESEQGGNKIIHERFDRRGKRSEPSKFGETRPTEPQVNLKGLLKKIFAWISYFGIWWGVIQLILVKCPFNRCQKFSGREILMYLRWAYFRMLCCIYTNEQKVGSPYRVCEICCSTAWRSVEPLWSALDIDWCSPFKWRF